MLTKLQKRNSEGFTIIEVMIVLAIAALILLIVLLAVPALQRNSRNTTIKNDASSVAGGINTFESDNNGKTPNYVGSTAGKVTIGTGVSACAAPAAGAASETINVNGSTTVNCGQTGLADTDKVGGVVTDGSTANIYVKFGASCADSGAQISTGVASARAVAIYYLTEISGGNSLQCVSS